MQERNIITVRLLGGFAIACRGVTLDGSAHMRDNLSWNLLAYLLWRHQNAMSAAELSPVFGEGFQPERDGNALRVRLHRSRLLLAPLGLDGAKTGLLLCRQNRFYLNPAYEIRVDTDEMDAACASLSVGGSTLLEDCLRALSLYCGPFLHTLFPQPWITEQRRRYERLFAALAETAVQELNRRKDYVRLDSLSERLLAVCPENIALQAQLLQAMLRRGLIGEAANHYAHAAVCLVGTGLTLPDFRDLMKLQKI